MFITFYCEAQIDSKKKSFAIPIAESETDSLDRIPLTPSKPIKSINSQLNIPDITPNLEAPKKTFSMFPEEEFANPGELYTKRLDKLTKDIKIAAGAEGYENINREDVYWGDYTTTSEFIKIMVADYGAVDGDLLQIKVNDEVILPRVFLGRNYSGFNLKLKEGRNTIEFLALNEGAQLPNTAAYKILDGEIVVSSKIWALFKGVKVTFVIIKE